MSLATLPTNISLRIVPRPAVKLAGIRIRTDMQTAREDVKQLWHDAMPEISKLASGTRDAPTYGVSWVIDAETCSFDYCVAVKSGRDSVLPEEFEETIIPAGLYAECSLPSREALYRLYNYLYYEWLPAQDESMVVGDTPCYEVYPDNYLKGGHMKLYIPIVGA
ncbi:GyrI-like domain-containing protein [Oxalobacter vibrioformis]|uniref:GyrI-like domain-containing protein n=1 Tax=Oxalobacter vibrioformis TaxID=933080 RepID=A0A9E9P2Z2_9BURK|nr:GyrI-like domain-containing protein [Oxalobacter vibrioformis]NLC23278.1 GyrI-like domain-containing protein [Oxalobacter sp.]WAW09705.1 GyrI-like domain-containing protein [Oxalobacter vibrioformis]